ncbi:SubName: Full=Uncharacterized protein {ECO:0000313/EMBL:CCA75378.1} [Serendipita indica DSM 11827]|nr:SubName: Full=Uncharacterized protein {ECO:0000313/EMBL:CCA75378.1} [Serendipita indica DSM 11827]
MRVALSQSTPSPTTMAQAFTLPPPPHAPRRHASRAQLHHPSTTTVRPEPSVPSMPTQAPRDVKPVQVSQPSASKPMDTSSNADASSSSRQGRSFKRSLKAAFSRSAPSSPERTPAALPEFPSELATTVAFVKNKSESTKPAKKSKSSKKKDTEVRYHAESKNHRPVTYQTAVELNMLLGGGSAEYWLAQTRQTGEEDDGVGNGVEVGGFQDDSGQIWWDMQEKVEFTSLLPKDAQGAPVHHTDDMWVEFDNGGRRNSTSSSSAQSTISYLSSELEEISGSLFYGYGAPEMEALSSAFHATTCDCGDRLSASSSSELAIARSVIAQANRQMYNKSAVVLADGFEDHFLSYESETNAKRINQQPAVQVSMVKATKSKGGLLKNLWGSKQTAH